MYREIELCLLAFLTLGGIGFFILKYCFRPAKTTVNVFLLMFLVCRIRSLEKSCFLIQHNFMSAHLLNSCLIKDFDDS